MLDENLPVFFLKSSGSGIQHHRDLYLSHHGSDPAPSYSVQSADPASASLEHKNCYAAALFDSYNPEILYGEVLARPGWTQPTLSAEELRKHDGIPPPPQPVLPSDFTIQLYNPEQQIRVTICAGKWGGSDSYEFSMPQNTFRTPSASNLDRGQSDPGSLAITPKLNFVWRRESKLSKDLTCFMTGRSNDAVGSHKKSSRKDPDIAIALWRSLRELTVYEPNLARLELEDPKGLEVVLLLSAVVIKDLFFASKEHVRTLFNISPVTVEGKLASGGRKLTNPPPPLPASAAPLPRPTASAVSSHVGVAPSRLPHDPRHHHPGPPPVADPRTQWELDAETARLRAQADAEAKEERRRRHEREKAEEAERRRLQRMVEEEERQARQRQAAVVDQETERLRKMYGVQGPPPPPSSSSSTNNTAGYQWPGRDAAFQRPPVPPRPGAGSSNGGGSGGLMMSGGNPGANSNSLDVARPAKKKSFFRLRSGSND